LFKLARSEKLRSSGFHSPSIATKEATKMEESKEAGVSIWIWVAVIGIAAVLIAMFVIFLRP